MTEMSALVSANTLVVCSLMTTSTLYLGAFATFRTLFDFRLIRLMVVTHLVSRLILRVLLFFASVCGSVSLLDDSLLYSEDDDAESDCTLFDFFVVFFPLQAGAFLK